MRRWALLTVPLLVAALWPAAGQATAGYDERQSAGTIRSVALTSSPSEASAYWTDDRMAAAEPRVVELPGRPPPRSAGWISAGRGEPGTVEPAYPTAHSRSVARSREDASGPIPYERYEITDPSAFPASTQGKLFYTDAQGDWVCSGTVVNSENESVVWTAGHCVQSEGNDGANFMFVPRYRDGLEPAGRWFPDEVWAASRWLDFEDSSYDIAAFVMSPNTSGQHIVEVVGGAGITWNVDPTTQFFRSFGYPAAAPFTGQRLFTCESGYGWSDAGSPQPIAIGCDMTGGSSGGGWLVEHQYLNSLNSYAYAEQPEVMYGPYFGDAAASLFEAVSTADAGIPPVLHAMGVSLSLVGHLAATGRVFAKDGYLPCTRNAPVTIWRNTGRGWGRVATRNTSTQGTYWIRLPDVPGIYAAYTSEGYVDAANDCGDAWSYNYRHRH